MFTSRYMEMGITLFVIQLAFFGIAGVFRLFGLDKQKSLIIAGIFVALVIGLLIIRAIFVGRREERQRNKEEAEREARHKYWRSLP